MYYRFADYDSSSKYEPSGGAENCKAIVSWSSMIVHTWNCMQHNA